MNEWMDEWMNEWMNAQPRQGKHPEIRPKNFYFCYFSINPYKTYTWYVWLKFWALLVFGCHGYQLGYHVNQLYMKNDIMGSTMLGYQVTLYRKQVNGYFG